MANPILNAPHFQNEQAAFAYVEAALWPDGPFCPHCGVCDRIKRLAGKSTRPGLFKCYGCSKQFTVRMGTIFESSHLPLHLWLQVIHLMCASKKGIATRQIQRMFQCSMKTAWFVCHRVRELMRIGDVPPLGGEDEVIEGDITFVGKKKGYLRARGGHGHMNPVFALVQRGGHARAFHMPSVRAQDIHPILEAHANRASHFRTDEDNVFTSVGWNFVSHKTTNHSLGQYALPGGIHSNTVENFFSVLKRGMNGVYQSVSEAHLQRYLAEFSFRYSHREGLNVDDSARASIALSAARGRRLTYETTDRRRRNRDDFRKRPNHLV